MSSRLMFYILALVILLICWALVRRDKSGASRFSLDDLLTDDATGKTSLPRCVMAGAFAFSVWLMAYLTLQGKMTEGYFTIFGSLWVTPIVVKILAERVTIRSVTTADGAQVNVDSVVQNKNG